MTGHNNTENHESTTQITRARQGVITPQMVCVAQDEDLDPELIRSEVARGRMVIPANPRHERLHPIGIGIAARCKINANIGTSPTTSGLEEELEKVRIVAKYGADTVMDLSTGGDINAIRQAIIQHSTIPVGTVPIYQMMTLVEEPRDLTPRIILDVIRMQAEQGVDFMTLHAGILRCHIPLAAHRLTGIVSRGGSIMADWMMHHQSENPMYALYEDILDICREHDVTISIGDALRPGCLADASDEAQFAELDVMAELTERTWSAGVQVMIEGPGHVPLDQIAMNVEREMRVCREAPFYVLGPIVTDVAPGYDHITSAIGATVAAYHGAAMLCYVTPKEHLGLPNVDDVRQGVIAYKIAAHAADVARGRPGARDRDDAISRARYQFQWEKQFELSVDPELARIMHDETLPEREFKNVDYCSMCGPRFCSMKRNLAIQGTGEAGSDESSDGDRSGGTQSQVG